MNSFTIFLGALVLLLAVVIAAPLALIWSLNTLFTGLNIPYTFETWAAALIISSMLSATGVKRKG